MGNIRKRHDAGLKAKVAFGAAKGEKTISEMSSEYGLHPNQIRQWKRQLFEELPLIFTDKRRKAERGMDELEGELYRQIGQLKVELDW